MKKVISISIIVLVMAFLGYVMTLREQNQIQPLDSPPEAPSTLTVKKRKVPLSKERFTQIIKGLVTDLKNKDTKSIRYMVVSLTFSSWSENEDVESIIGIKKEWFARMSKGLGILATVGKQIEDNKKVGNKEELIKLQEQYKVVRSRLITVYKMKKEYYIKKWFFCVLCHA